MFAALFCVQKSTGKTIQSSINRVLGTLVGGVVGVLTVYAMDTLNILHIDLLRFTAPPPAPLDPLLRHRGDPHTARRAGVDSLYLLQLNVRIFADEFLRAARG